MLTGDLVRIRGTRDGLKCGFIDAANAKMLEKAEAILAAFEEHVGQSRGALDEALLEIEGDGIDHKLTRGLAKLCLDRSEFDTTAPLPPAELRRAVFSLAARIGPVQPPDLAEELAEELAGDHAADPAGAPCVDPPPARAPTTAATVWRALAGDLGLPADILAHALYADLPSEQTLTAFDVPSPSWLLLRYNVALVQSALVRALRVTVTLPPPRPGELRAILRAIKFHQLIADVRATPSAPDGPPAPGYTITIDGPESLYSQTTRYGTALARFFPALLLLKSPWHMQAQVKWNNRATTLELGDDAGLVSHYKAQGAWQSREATWFFERWRETVPGWTIEEGGTPLDQGGEGVVVPDFTLRHEADDRPIHLEILGFWRKGSLKRRLELCARHGPERLILAVSRKLLQADKGDGGGEAEPDAGGSTLPEGVVLFTETVPIKEVLRVAEAMRAKPARRAAKRKA